MPVDLQKLTEPFPQTAIKHRSGGGGKSLAYVEGHTVIHRLNAATENSWSFTVDRIDDRRLGDSTTLMMAHCTLTIPGLGSRSHVGVQLVNDRGGEDLVKGAITDALKKAATLFGVALELYGPDYESGEIATTNQERPGRQEANRAAREHNNAQIAPQAPRPLPPSKPDYEQRSPSVLPPIQPGGAVSDTLATSAQLKAIEDIGGRLGLAFADIDKIARDITGGPIEGIRNRQASTLIKHLGNLQRSGGQSDLGLKPAAMAAQ